MAVKRPTEQITTPRFRSYKNDGKGFDLLEANDEITGTFIQVRDREIRDRRTKEPKTIRVYSLMTDRGLLKIGSRALLDGVFDDILDEHGGYTKNGEHYVGPGIDWLRNRLVRFTRGSDTKTSDGNPMGTYEIQVEED